MALDYFTKQNLIKYLYTKRYEAMRFNSFWCVFDKLNKIFIVENGTKLPEFFTYAGDPVPGDILIRHAYDLNQDDKLYFDELYEYINDGFDSFYTPTTTLLYMKYPYY